MIFLEMITKRNPMHHYYIQIFIVTVSNILCWIPSGIIYLVALFLKKYPVNLIIWSTIAVTPINSVINPVVFIVANFRSHKRKRNFLI